MIKIKTIKEHDAIGVDLHIEGLKVMCAVELKAKINGVECVIYDFIHADGTTYCNVAFPNLYNMKFLVLASLIEVGR